LKSTEPIYISIIDEQLNFKEDEEIEPACPGIQLSNVLPLIRFHVISIFVNFLVTLALFPAMTSAIVSTKSDASNALFTTIHFLVFNLADWLGKSIPAFYNPKISSKHLHLLTFMRLIFIPLFFLCNIMIRDSQGANLPRSMPLLFGDVQYYTILFVFALANGWLGTLLLIDAPLQVQSLNVEEWTVAQGMVGDTMVYGLSLGLAFGSLSSFGFRAIVCQCNPFITS
jgi:equilibrative nucleoside transporter 1/2/3